MSPKQTDSTASSAEVSGDSPAIVGIDLGTTYSAIARLDDLGRPTTLANAEGDLVTPSAVLIDGRDIVVGKEALKAMPTEPERVAHGVKRDVGQELYHRSLDGRKFPPEVLQALILKKLTSDARRQIGDFHQVVVTVPAYFDEVRRKSTQDAGYIAGLDVVDIINEPTAAAVSFGFQQGFLDRQGEASSPKKILVYDLGGGTFDVTLMEISGSDFKALATGGDVQLGGLDWDQRLVDYVAELFLNKHSVDPREDPSAAGRLWRDCEDAKRTLSARSKASIACDYRGLALRVEVTREKFQELTADLIDRSRFTTRQVLKDAGLGWSDVDRVLLVGGSSRMPMVREMLKMLSGSEPDSSVSADEAVAHGAALYAGILVGKEDSPYRPKFKIQNVNSHTLGIVGTNPQTGRKRVAALIPRNTKLPVTAKRTFKTQRAGQRSVLVQIVEGESTSPEACTPIGQCTIKDLPPNLPKHSPVKVEFRYGADSRLTVFVELPGAGLRARHEIDRTHGLEKSGLDSWRKWVEDVWQG